MSETPPEAEDEEKVEKIVLVKRYVDVGDGNERSILTLFEDYRIWKAWDGRWRWVYSAWKDDDYGLQSHGASRTLKGVVIAIIDNRNFRREVYGLPKIKTEL